MYSTAHYEMKSKWIAAREAEKKAKRDALTIKWRRLDGEDRRSDCGTLTIMVYQEHWALTKVYHLFQTDTAQRLASSESYLKIRSDAELFLANPGRRTNRGTRRKLS